MRFIYFNYTLMYEFRYTLEKTGFKFFFQLTNFYQESSQEIVEVLKSYPETRLYMNNPYLQIIRG